MQVHFDDQIKLESMKTQGQFLHVGSRNQAKAGYDVLGQWLVYPVGILIIALKFIILVLKSTYQLQNPPFP